MGSYFQARQALSPDYQRGERVKTVLEPLPRPPGKTPPLSEASGKSTPNRMICAQSMSSTALALTVHISALGGWPPG